jgi:hypothetical protein
MAIGLAGASSFHTVRLEYEASGSNNKVTKTFKIDGTLDDTAMLAVLTALQNCSNAGIVQGSVDGRKITGWQAPITALQDLLGAVMVLNFQRTNPVNSAKTVSHNFIVPAYKSSVKGDDGKPLDTDTNLSALISALQSGIVILGSDGNYYTGSFTYVKANSGFATVDMEEIE